MISPDFFINVLSAKDIGFFAGIPDSLLKSMCAYLVDHKDTNHNIIAANEGAAIGLAAGHYLATGHIPVVYLQNSGEGNIINPLASLTDKEVYNIPVLLLIGWRGKPGVHDEPQHIKQGKVTIALLETMGIKNIVMSKDENELSKQINEAVNFMQQTKEAFAFIIEKDTFDSYISQSEVLSTLSMGREEAIRKVAGSIEPNACIVSTTGMISRELFEYRTAMNEEHERDFLTVGSMGHASQIALGIALQKLERRVYCFDGDGASIMHMGNMAITASLKPKNYVHVVFNNGAHDSVGGQPTVGLEIDLCAIAKAVGYKRVFDAKSMEDLESALVEVKITDGPVFLQICVKKGNRKELGRPIITPVQNKETFMKFLSE